MSVRDSIAAGKYENKLPYGKGSEARTAWREEDARLVKLFRADLEAEYGLRDHPKAARLWGIAWDYGHSSGYSEVAMYYDEFAELVK